jgi:hypothetical protein
MSEVFTYNFAALEAALASIDKGAVAHWVTTYEVFIEQKGVGKLTAKAFGAEWERQFKTRSGGTVAVNLSHIGWAVDNGYDVDTFVSMAHLIEVKSAAKGGTASVKFDAKKTAKKYATLNKRDRAALIAALQAL